MTTTSFNADWEVSPRVTLFQEAGVTEQWTPVTLPHDAMINGGRTADASGAKGYFPDGAYVYRKTFAVPDGWRHKRISFVFEGIMRDAMIYLNGDLAGRRPYGYSEFVVEADPYLRFGEDNTIRVDARTSDRDSRWYSGAGIYRPVHLVVSEPVHLAIDGVTVTTPDLGDGWATVVVATELDNDSPHTATRTIHTELVDADGAVVAEDRAPLSTRPSCSGTLRQRLHIDEVVRWSVDHPVLYTCRTQVLDGDEVVDEHETGFGIRALSLDPIHGLRINGETVKLRGACVHHDNGPLGAATIGRAEERRVELLKAAGFNAVRSAHNPISRAFLDACDHHGVLVMDETFDMWTEAKLDHDYALVFEDWWHADLEAMVRKDRNHPSVILYSIGNEISEVRTPLGAARGRELADAVRALDPTRYVTNSINPLLCLGEDAGALIGDAAKATEAERAIDETMTGVNSAMATWEDMLPHLLAQPLVAERTAEAYAHVDVAGYNYADSRYLIDRDLFPHRVIVGSETFAKAIDRNWATIEAHGHLLGDFTWTGWDYLGEAGIGRVEYQEDSPATGFAGAYPWLVAFAGDIDITGHRRPQSYYREIVFGLRTDPYLAVGRPERHDSTIAHTGPWSWTDAVASWSWVGHEDQPVRIEVYSPSDEIELLVNGISIGRSPTGPKHRYKAVFDTVYQLGELVAVAYDGDCETGRTTLRSATGDVLVDLSADRAIVHADEADLAYVTLTLQDADGNLVNTHDRTVEISVEGPGLLQGFGTGDPKPTETFAATRRTTHDGRALAIIRPTRAGTITIRATADGCDPVAITIEAT